MSDDLPDVQFSDQTDETSSKKTPDGAPDSSAPGLAQPIEPAGSEPSTGQPVESSPASDERTGMPQEADYAAELRQSLRQESSQPEKPAPHLWQRMTRSLRRDRQPDVAASPTAGETPAHTLAEPPTSLTSPGQMLEGETSVPESPGMVDKNPESAEPAETPEAETPGAEKPDQDDEWLPEGLAVAQYLDTLAPDANPPDETAASEADWMANLRRETVPPEASDAENEESRGTDSLREFIARLRGQGMQEKDAELSDDLLTGRLERSLGLSPQDNAPTETNTGEPDQVVFDTSQAPLFEKTSPYAAEPLPADLDLSEIFPDPHTSAEHEGSLPENQEAGFSGTNKEKPLEERLEALSYSAGAVPAGQEPTSQPQAGQASTPPEAAAPLETPTPASAQPLDLSKVEGKRASGGTARLSVDDAYAATYLTGIEHTSSEEEVQSPDYLLQQALDRAYPAEPVISNEDLRAIALEGYQETPGSQPGAAAPAENIGGSPTALQWVDQLRAQFASRSLVEKILLVEAVVAALVVIVAVPFFISAIMHGTSHQAITSATITPRSLPSNLPYPVGITLPGGWYFPLAKSTFINGKWQPATSEWLEGTEVRRVVAVPWNAQTEAVIRSFKPGDVVRVLLSNQETVEYKVTSIKRVPVTDTSILKDQTPSLVIILYQENADERWVILSEP